MLTNFSHKINDLAENVFVINIPPLVLEAANPFFTQYNNVLNQPGSRVDLSSITPNQRVSPSKTPQRQNSSDSRLAPPSHSSSITLPSVQEDVSFLIYFPKKLKMTVLILLLIKMTCMFLIFLSIFNNFISWGYMSTNKKCKYNISLCLYYKYVC